MNEAISRFHETGDLNQAVDFLKDLYPSEESRAKLISDYSWEAYSRFSDLGILRVREKNYSSFLRISDRLYPPAQLCSYFYECYEKNILDLNGINLLIGHFQSKSDSFNQSYPQIEAIDISSLPEKIHTITRELGEATYSMIVRPFGKHVTPIFIQKKWDQIFVISLDSLGETQYGYNWGSRIEKIIRGASLMPVEMYKFQFPRQIDGISCAIFSLRDLIENSRGNLFKWLREARSLHENSIFQTAPHSFLIRSLPSSFHKVTQHGETLKPYLALLEPVTEDGRTLLKLKQSEPKVDYTRQKAYKYFSILISKVLGIKTNANSLVHY
ncbi:MAG: hypothetical protein ACO3A2_04705 [Bdellovibrionia bacterium]